MKITNLFANNVRSKERSAYVDGRVQGGGGKESRTAGPSDSSDRVEVSTSAVGLAAAIREAASEVIEPASPARIDALKEAIRNGELKIDTHALARAILKEEGPVSEVFAGEE